MAEEHPSRKHRLRPLHIALAVLVAGWLPTILMALVSYRSVSDALERRIVVDRRTLVNTLSALLGYDLTRTREVIDYYRTLPTTAAMAAMEPGSLEAQDWLAGVYYGQPRIDGMFLARPDGSIIAALPRGDATPGAAASVSIPEIVENGVTVTPVHRRAPDDRLVTAVVTGVRSKRGELLGYLGAQILVERLGRRLTNYDFGEQSVAQVIDQRGVPIFSGDFTPSTVLTPDTDELTDKLRRDPDGIFRHKGDLYTAFPIDDTGWIALLRQPLSVAYRPIHELVRKTAFPAAWLIIGTAIVAWGVSRLYSQQRSGDERIQREMLFSEKIIASMPVGVAVFDPATEKPTKTNARFREMARQFGEISTPVEHARFGDFAFLSGDMFEKTVKHSTPFVAPETRVTDREGKPHFLALNVFPIQDPGGELLSILLLVDDTTSNATIRQELIAANVAKDQFLALLSHELRTPLSPVFTMVGELEEKMHDDPDACHALEVIRRNVELEARLIDDLLDLSRIAYNKLKLELDTIDAHKIIRRVVEICRSDLSAKGVQMSLSLDAAQHHVQADSARLHQVLWNLLKNAVKFTPSGGIVTIATRNEDRKFVLEVADTGAGIDPAKIGTIFNIFEQGGTDVTRQFGGLGLGLAISRAIVDAHGGKIYASSAGMDEGSTFTIELAVTDPRPEAALPVRSSPAPAAPASRGFRILVVDDHEDTVRGMERLLKRRGYEVETAASVAEAIERAESSHFDLLISDLGLPDGSGIDILKRLRAHTNIKGIAISGFGAESDREQSRNAGFSDHLVKPVSVERLEEALARILI